MSDVPDRRRLLSRSWTEFPDDVMSSILARLGAIEILQTAQKVCTTWRRICKQPSMWRRIDMSNKWSFPSDQPFDLDRMCRHAIDRSYGSLVEIKLQNFGNNELLKYITDSSSRIRSLQLVNCYIKDEGFSEVASKLSVLEDLEISVCGGYISHKTVEVVGQACPLLKSFKLNCFRFMLNKQNLRLSLTIRDGLRKSLRTCDEEALAISRTMQDLHHLKLVGNMLTNDGLWKIIDSCTNLESLDLRCCYHLNLAGDLGRCAEQIKSLRLPNDSVDDIDYLSSTTVNCHIAPYEDDYSDFDEEEDDDSEFDEEADYRDTMVMSGVHVGALNPSFGYELDEFKWQRKVH